MRFFITQSTAEGDLAVEGTEPHSLPLMTCPHCKNFRGATWVTYPWIDLGRVLDGQTERRLREGRGRIYTGDFTWTEFEDIKIKIRRVLDPALPLPPSAMFGMFAGKVYARPPATDFVMLDGPTLLARRRVAERLNALGNNLQIFEVKLKQQKGRNEDLVQIWAPPIGNLGPSAHIEWCNYCERSSVGEADVLDQSSVPAGTHLFVVKASLYSVIVSEKLVDDIEKNRFSRITYKPIPCE
jgi:hypothetical protein